MELTVSKRAQVLTAASWLAGYLVAQPGWGEGKCLADRNNVLAEDLVAEDFDQFAHAMQHTDFIERQANMFGLNRQVAKETIGNDEFLAATKDILVRIVGAILKG